MSSTINWNTLFRFSAEEKGKRDAMSYLPFGDGPRYDNGFCSCTKVVSICNCRNCVGMRFALLETKLGIVKALRLVEIQQCEKTEVRRGNFSILYEISI